MTAVLSALTQLGVGYRYASSEPGVAFDCSGLTSWAWSQAGIDIPHQSRSQINVAKRLDIDEARPGDLLYYPGHVMLALGLGDAVVHAVKPGTPVEVKSQRRRGGRLLAGSVVTGDVPDDGALDGA
jgi:cell wall-associated NlpC family hydrolase